MRDAERVEIAHPRFGRAAPKFRISESTSASKVNGFVPMGIGNIQLKKLTHAERKQCRKEVLCLHCRGEVHIANECPKGRETEPINESS